MNKKDIINMLTPNLMNNINRLNTNIDTHDKQTILNIVDECYESYKYMFEKIYGSDYRNNFTVFFT